MYVHHQRAKSWFRFTAAAKEASQMFAPANVRHQRVTFTQYRSVGRLDVCTSIGGWLSTGEDKEDVGVYCLALVIRQR